MDEAIVFAVVANHGTRVTYYVVPAETADEIVDAEDLDRKVAEVDEIITFYGLLDFTEWYSETDVDVLGDVELRDL